MKAEKLKIIQIKPNGKIVDRLDALGKWPTGTWLQRRLALLKLAQAQGTLNDENK